MRTRDRKNILIVEDDEDIAQSMANVMKKLGYGITGIIPTAEEAYTQVEESEPDLVIMDIRLKGELEGTEVGGRIENLFHIPVVYVTGYAGKSVSIEGLEKILLIKPFTMAELESAVRIALLRSDQQQRYRE